MGQKDLSTPVSKCLTPVKTFLHIDSTVDEAVQQLRDNSQRALRKNGRIIENIVYFYVVDDEGVLQGVVSARDLLREAPKAKIANIMDSKVVACRERDTLMEAMELLHGNHLLAVPVIDSEKKLIGAIDVRQYIDESQEFESTRFTDDIFQLFGVTLEDGKQGTAFRRFTRRMPWVLCNMVGGIFCAIISRVYEEVLAEMLLLAMFIPLVLTLSESISMQSMTQSLQYLRKSHISFRQMVKQSLGEWKIIGMLSITCGVLVGVISLFWGDGTRVAMVIALGLSIGIALSAVIGCTIPYLLHARKLDPKVAAGPVVLMFADVLTTAIYLTLATSLLL